MNKNNKVCVIGLGYIGIPTSILLALNGYKVIGYDIDRKITKLIKSKKLKLTEPGLTSRLNEVISKNKFVASNKIEVSDIYVICVPTPFYGKGTVKKPDLAAIRDVFHKLVKILKDEDTVIIESTCPVGTTKEMIKFLKNSKVDVNKINFAYCPERVLPGKILYELEFNDRIIGAINKKTSRRVNQFYKSFVKGRLHLTDLETAEMSKLAENAFRDVNIAFANEISLICESQDIDYNKVIKLANKHPRVSILEPGIGVGGHCIPVDPWFIISKNLKLSQILQSARSVNSYKTKWISKKIINQVSIYKTKYKKNPIVSLFGLTYKANVSDLRESPSLDIFNHLKKEKIDKIRLVEPNVEKYEKNRIHNFKIAFKNSDILCFLVNHKEFSFLDKSILREEQQLLDFCGVFSSE